MQFNNAVLKHQLMLLVHVNSMICYSALLHQVYMLSLVVFQQYVFYGHLITLFVYGNAIALVFTYPLSRGVVAAVRSKTRMELFLYGCYPEGLERCTGDMAKDRMLWDDEDEAEVTPRRLIPTESKASVDIVTNWLDDSPSPHYGHADVYKVDTLADAKNKALVIDNETKL